MAHWKLLKGNGDIMRVFKIKSVDFGWTAKIRTSKNYSIGDLCICRGQICTIVEEIPMTEDFTL